MKRLLLASASSLALLVPAHAQQNGCRTSPLNQQAITNYCASEAFVSRHFPASSTAGHVATFGDSSGQVLVDGGPAGGISSLSGGQGIALSPDPIVSTGTVATSPGVDANVLVSQTSDRTVQTSDCGKTINVSGGSWTVTLPAVTGFDGKCTITVVDASTTRGQKLSGFPSDLYPILYPSRALQVKIINGAWATTINPGRWAKQNVDFYVDTSGAGNNSNDGLAAGSGGAFATLNQCRTAAQVSIDTISQGNGGVTCHVPSGQTTQEFVQVFFPLVGGGTLIFQGDGGQFNWVPANSSYALQFGDLGVVGATNVNFTTTGSTSPAGLILGHNYGILDLNTGITFTASSPAVTTAMSCDFDAHFNINNGFHYVGTFSTALYQTCQNSSWNFNGAQVNDGTTSVGRYFIHKTSSKVIWNGNVTFTAGTLSGSTGLLTGNSVFNNLSGLTPPLGAPTGATGAQYCTSEC